MQFLSILIIVLQNILDASFLVLRDFLLDLLLHFTDNFAFVEFLTHTLDSREVLVILLCSDEVQRIFLLALALQVLLVFEGF